MDQDAGATTPGWAAAAILLGDVLIRCGMIADTDMGGGAIGDIIIAGIIAVAPVLPCCCVAVWLQLLRPSPPPLPGACDVEEDGARTKTLLFAAAATPAPEPKSL